MSDGQLAIKAEPSPRNFRFSYSSICLISYSIQVDYLQIFLKNPSSKNFEATILAIQKCKIEDFDQSIPYMTPFISFINSYDAKYQYGITLVFKIYFQNFLKNELKSLKKLLDFEAFISIFINFEILFRITNKISGLEFEEISSIPEFEIFKALFIRSIIQEGNTKSKKISQVYIDHSFDPSILKRLKEPELRDYAAILESSSVYLINFPKNIKIIDFISRMKVFQNCFYSSM